MKVIGIIIYYNRITKVRSRHAVKLPAVQPVVIRTAQGAAGERKINKYKKGKYYG